MSAAENKSQAQSAYKAFDAGDMGEVMRVMADDIEWVVPGNSTISGVYRGKEEVAGFFQTIAAKSFRTEPQHFIADGDHVVVLTRISADGQSADQADVLTFGPDGKITNFTAAADTAFQERVWGKR
ncbi:nuclear transport factor 2 family protein [Terrabacter sp. NPDC080008]|uniref:nuclear transport factor 2 family protein n=1 Tax=Terrabacter sp. NPDC080008 TaxID=3155176 RepID=UPI00344E58C9